MGRRTFELRGKYFAGHGGGGDFAKPDGTSEPHNYSERGQGPWKTPDDVRVVGSTVAVSILGDQVAARVTLESDLWPEGDEGVCVLFSQAMLDGPEFKQYRALAMKAKRARARAAAKKAPKTKAPLKKRKR